MRSLLFLVSIVFILLSCKQKHKPGFVAAATPGCTIDSVSLAWFFARYPNLLEHRNDVFELYRDKTSCAWFSGNRLSEQAHVLYTRLLEMGDEGLPGEIPYREELESVMSRSNPETNSDILLSALYFYYTCQIYGGLDHDRAMEAGWFIPREKSVYPTHVDSVLRTTGKRVFISQYYNLRAALRKYRAIEKRGGWQSIEMPEDVKELQPGDSSAIIDLVRERLAMEGFKTGVAGSDVLNVPLADAIEKYLTLNQRTPARTITPGLLKMLNIPVSARIRTISLNMERCRWMSPNLALAPEYIAVNIPSYRLLYFRDGEPFITSRVVVGKELNQTVVFSGEISYITFSPYWNVPPGILKNEILPAIAKDPEYLQKHDMEWFDKRVRQRPGPNNSLGLVKFMFPNSNNIYLHDTPAKSLFAKDNRALSHGCVRVEKARELAVAITQKDGDWNEDMVNQAMNRGTENHYKLRKKIPVYLAYFTAWSDAEGNTAFFDDIYKRDTALANLLFKPDGKN